MNSSSDFLKNGTKTDHAVSDVQGIKTHFDMVQQSTKRKTNM